MLFNIPSRKWNIYINCYFWKFQLNIVNKRNDQACFDWLFCDLWSFKFGNFVGGGTQISKRITSVWNPRSRITVRVRMDVRASNLNPHFYKLVPIRGLYTGWGSMIYIESPDPKKPTVDKNAPAEIFPFQWLNRGYYLMKFHRLCRPCRRDRARVCLTLWRHNMRQIIVL